MAIIYIWRLNKHPRKHGNEPAVTRCSTSYGAQAVGTADHASRPIYIVSPVLEPPPAATILRMPAAETVTARPNHLVAMMPIYFR